MEMILINDTISNIVLYLDKNHFYGYRFFNDNKIEKIDKDVFKYFSFIYPSKNYTKLEDEDGYHVILDNDTNFKHYIKNGSFDYNKFIENNGQSIFLYNNDNNDDLLDNSKHVFKYYNKTLKRFVTIGLGVYAIIMVNLFYQTYQVDQEIKELESQLNNIKKDERIVDVIEFEQLTKEDLEKMIYASDSLPSVYKKYLNNQDLFEDILPYINESNYMKYMYYHKFDNINIKTFEHDERFDNCEDGFVSGYYDPLEPNSIYILEKKNGIDYPTDDTISHEFIHLCQLSGKQDNLLIEVTAEMYSHEYFENSEEKTYTDQIKTVKKLMEIIGTEPIKKMIFTGDFSSIEAAVKPYLSEEEYKVFLDSFSFNSMAKNDTTELDKIIPILYERIYNDDINNNELFKLIDKNDGSLVRYYFNPRLINEENSYYLDYNNMTTEYLTYKEAYEKGLIKILPDLYIDEFGGKYYYSRSISYEELITGNYNNYKIILNGTGDVDFEKQIIALDVPTKVYIEPIKEINTSLTR